jgi:8-oxo-dGTP pyrophosphatase MutT (NUDIX family)
MIQKKDTISYIEFIRGKYDINNLNYLKMLFSGMTHDEKRDLDTLDFREIWGNLWSSTSNDSKFQREYYKSVHKFNRLKAGFTLAKLDGSLQFVNITHLINLSSSTSEQDWEFPKGRRKLHESDIDCSIREFREEVGLNERIFIHDVNKQYEEIFQGSNNIRYRNIYYIAQFIGDESLIKFDSTNVQQAKEVRDVNWFSHTEVLRNLNMNRKDPEKVELFKRINSIITKNYLI